MGSPKPQYNSFIGLSTWEELEQAHANAEEVFKEPFADELIAILGMDNDKKDVFIRDLIDAYKHYQLNKLNEGRTPTRGQSKAALEDIAKSAYELHQKLCKVDMLTKGRIATNIFNENKVDPLDAYDDIIDVLEILREAALGAKSKPLPKVNGQNRWVIRTYITDICRAAQTYAPHPLKISLSKEPSETMSGNLADFLDQVLAKTLGGNYTQHLSIGEIHKAAKKAMK